MEIRSYAGFCVHERMILEALTHWLIAASSVKKQAAPLRTVWPTELSDLS